MPHIRRRKPMKKSLSPLSLSLSLVLCLSDYHSLSLSLSVFDFFSPEFASPVQQITQLCGGTGRSPRMETGQPHGTLTGPKHTHTHTHTHKPNPIMISPDRKASDDRETADRPEILDVFFFSLFSCRSCFFFLVIFFRFGSGKSGLSRVKTR